MESYATAHPQTQAIKMTSQIGLNTIRVSALHWLQAHSITPRAVCWLTACETRDAQHWSDPACWHSCYDIASLPPNLSFPTLTESGKKPVVQERDFSVSSEEWQVSPTVHFQNIIPEDLQETTLQAKADYATFTSNMQALEQPRDPSYLHVENASGLCPSPGNHHLSRGQAAANPTGL